MKQLIYKTKSGSKIYSAAYTRSSFIRKCTGFSIEFIHNCIRIILRPNSSSRNHWIRELIPWFKFQFECPLNSKFRPSYGLFNAVLHRGSTDSNMKWADDFILTESELVSREPYGEIENSINIVGNSLKSLYELTKDNSCNSISNAVEVFNEWLEEIPGFIK